MSAPKIDSYTFSLMIIDGNTFRKDLIILPDRVINDWWRKSGHTLIPEDIQVIFDSSPDLLIVGTGSVDRLKITDEAIKKIKENGIELIALPTGKAWQIYNKEKDKKKVAAAFHLTC